MNKEKKGFNKNIILSIIAVPLLVAVGVIAGNYLSNPGTEFTSWVEAKEEQVEETTIPLEEFLLNLEPGNNTGRFVRLEVSLSTVHEEGAPTIEANLPKIRDIIIRTVSTQTIDEMFHEDNGTLVLKNLLKAAINENLEEDIIHNVYITNIIMQ